MRKIKEIDQYAKDDAKVVITMVVTMDDEPIATMEMDLAPKLPGQYDDGMTYDTDPVIEDLGKWERGVFPFELKKRYERYAETLELENELESEG